MNAARRKELMEVWQAISDQRFQLESVIQDEQSAFESMPEGLQGSSNGQRMEEGISTLEDALSELDSALENLSGLGLNFPARKSV